MPAPLYPDSAIDQALQQAVAPYWHETNRRKVAKVRAQMIALRDAAGPRQGTEPSPADLALALNLRAKDLLGMSSPAGFYLPPEQRR